MKKFSGLIAIACLLAGVAFCDSFVVSIANNAGTPSSKTTTPKSGYLHSLYVDITGATTGTLSIVAPSGEVIYTNTVTADKAIYPRFITETSAGASLGGGTNGYAKYLLSAEALTFNLSEAAPSTNTYNITVKLRPVDK